MKSLIIYLNWMFLLMVLFLSSCSVILEEDISDDVITVIAPVDSIRTTIATQTFSWNYNSDATSYRLQIVKPNFDYAELLLLDTLIEDSNYQFTLYAGDFEWRVRGENDAYETEWTTLSLFIVSTDDLSEQSIILRNPSDNYFCNNSQITFKWDTLTNADYYEMKQYTGDWEDELILDSSNIINGSLSLYMEEGELYWGIRALNDSSESGYSTRRLIIDLTSPNIPTLLTPEDSVSLDDEEVEFSWESSDLTWETVSDSLLIYTIDSSDDRTLYKSLLITEKSTTVELVAGNQYSWKVKSIDKAGNESEYCDSRIVTIEN